MFEISLVVVFLLDMFDKNRDRSNKCQCLLLRELHHSSKTFTLHKLNAVRVFVKAILCYKNVCEHL